MKALFTSFPASAYAASKDFYENSLGLPVLRESLDGSHRFTNYDLGGRCCTIKDPFGNLFDLIDARMKGDA